MYQLADRDGVMCDIPASAESLSLRLFLPTYSVPSMALTQHDDSRGSSVIATMLPIEVWKHIIKLAVSPTWTAETFLPPPECRELIQGFSDASLFFKRLASSVFFESQHFFSLDQFLEDTKVNPAAIRHLDLTFYIDYCRFTESEEFFLGDLTSLDEEPGRAEEIFLKVKGYSQLESFVLSGDFVRHISRVPSASRLVRLDCAILKDLTSWRNIDLRGFPCLEELRLRSPMTRETPPLFSQVRYLPEDDELAARIILNLISPLGRLRLLSIRVHLDSVRNLLEAMDAHGNSEDCVDIHAVDCPKCTKAYSHAHAIRAENAVTKSIAEHMPSLKRILWANAWMRVWEDESGQRGTSIHRKFDGACDGITLRRDDGLNG